MNFAESTRYLLSLGHETLAMKLGLRNTELLLQGLGNPQKSYEAVQIAGTNGKGSTAAMLDSICRAAGIPTGLYTSPHLVSITERIKINGESISEESFAAFASEVRTVAEDLLQDRVIEAVPTFFEHITAIALSAFQAANVRLVILETGLGGRLDATTVAGAKTIGITSISLDHQEYLGESIEEIAAEKAATIRPGVTAIIAPQTEPARKVISQYAKQVQVKPIFIESKPAEISTTSDGFFVVSFETHADSYENVLLGLRGRHQFANAALAIQLAESLRDRGFAIPKTAIIDGLKSAEHPGRLTSVDGNSILLDGAHNPAAARALRDYLDEFAPGPVTMVFGAMRDKPLEEMAAILFRSVAHLVLTQPDNVRAASLDVLSNVAGKVLGKQKILVAPQVDEALRLAREVTPVDGIICVTGSLYLVGEALATLQAAKKVSL